MSNDSHLFRTRDQLAGNGWRLAGNVFRKVDAAGRTSECLPLYEAKMVHHFDHRWATYEGGKTRELTVAEKQDPNCVVFPRYWVDAREVYLRTADLPKGLLDALRKGNQDGILFGVAHLLFALAMRRAFGDAADRALRAAFPSWIAFVSRHRFAGAVSPIGMVMGGDGPACFQPLDHSFVPAMPVKDLSLEELDIDALSRVPWWTRDDIRDSGTMWYAADHKGMAALLRFAADQGHLAEAADSAPALRGADDAVSWAEDLLVRRSPRWLMGWRDICRSTDERTLICGAVPQAAVGDKFLLLSVFADSSPSAGGTQAAPSAALLASLGSFACDFAARQKVGGTSLKYFTMRQVAVLPRSAYNIEEEPAFILPRVLELLYTAWDLQPFAQDCGWDGPPFLWDEERRFLLRAELDAAFFHLYLPSTREGEWQPAREEDGARGDETAGQLASLREHFPTPRDAVDYILETFPIVRRKDERKHGEYRTKRVILEIWDAMQTAMARGEQYRSPLDPPPADPRCCHPRRERSS